METNHRKAIILRGIPGSGKTTYAKKLVDQGYNRVNKDEIRHMINNYKLNNYDEQLVHKIQNDIIRQFLKDGRNFVIDNTHVKQKYVDQAVHVIERAMTYGETEYEYEIVIETIDVPLEVALERNVQRPVPVFEEVIKKMYKSLKG